MRYIAALATVVILAGAIESPAAPIDFMPKFAWFGGEFEVEGGYSRSKNSNNGNSSVHEQRGHIEKLIVDTIGYVYHPSLVYFEGEISGSITSESRRNSSSGDGGDWREDRLADEEYLFDGVVLGRKPLNLDFHLSMERPFLTSGYSSAGRVLELSKSEVSLNFKKKPFGSTLKYSHNVTERIDDKAERNLRSVSDTISERLNYWTSKFSFYSVASHKGIRRDGDIAISAIQSEKDTTDQFSFRSNLRYKRYVFDSGGEVMSRDASDKEEFRLMLKEDIGVTLPWNMDSEINLYHEQTEDNDFDVQENLNANVTTNDNKLYAALHHQLFKSVSSTLSGDYQQNKSITSERTEQRYLLTARYIKQIRRGKINSLVQNELIRTEDHGPHAVDDERSTEVIEFIGDSFLVAFSGAVAESVVVEVLNTECQDNFQCPDIEDDPLSFGSGARGEWQPIPQDQWHVVDPNKQRLEIVFDRVGANPSDPALDITAFSPPLQSGPYGNKIIRVSYSLPNANFIVQSNTSSLSVNISLYDNMIFAHIDHFLTSQEYIEGDSTFGVLAPTVTGNEGGLTLTKSPFNMSTSYRVVASEVYDETRWIVDGNYAQGMKLFYKVNINWGAQYHREELWETGSNVEDANSLESELITRFGLFSKIPYTPLTISPQTSYTQERGGVSQYGINRTGIFEEVTSFVDDRDRDIYTNRLTISTIIPRINMKADFFVAYETEDNFTDNKEIFTKDIGFKTGRSKKWSFGGTTIILTGMYNFDMSRRETTGANGVFTSNNTDSEFEINLNIRRLLF